MTRPATSFTPWRRIARTLCAVLAVACTARAASAQVVDVTLFTGRAFPVYDERLTLRPGTPSFPGVEVTVPGSPLIRADGGPVFGAALAVEFGMAGIEGRLDATDVGLEFSGARYDLRGTAFPFQGLTASLIVAPGRFDAERIPLLSLNGRMRTRGRVAVIASGGLSYLRDIRVSGSIPLTVDAPDLPPLPDFNAALTLRGSPGQTGHRFGVNGGAGVRVGRRIALVAEIRGFYFGEYELRFTSANGPELLDELLAEAAPVRFRPVFVNAQAGVTFTF